MAELRCGEDPEPSDRFPAGPLYVPVRPGPAGCATRLFRTPLGGRTAVAFTSVRGLTATLGADQPWIRLAEPALRALTAPLGVTTLTVDPHLTAMGPAPDATDPARVAARPPGVATDPALAAAPSSAAAGPGTVAAPVPADGPGPATTPAAAQLRSPAQSVVRAARRNGRDARTATVRRWPPRAAAEPVG